MNSTSSARANEAALPARRNDLSPTFPQLLGMLSNREDAKRVPTLPRHRSVVRDGRSRDMKDDRAAPSTDHGPKGSGQRFAAGMVVAKRYRLDRLLGEGGMGVVWAATHTVTRRSVAMKFLRGETRGMSQDLRQRFLREARAASAVRHPNVVTITDVFELDDETPVMVMDLLVGETLGQKLARETKLTLEQTAAILLPVVSAVGTAHALGIIHRDLKPDNIFIVEGTPPGGAVRVLDFGIAKVIELEGEGESTGLITDTGAILGTPN